LCWHPSFPVNSKPAHVVPPTPPSQSFFEPDQVFHHCFPRHRAFSSSPFMVLVTPEDRSFQSWETTGPPLPKQIGAPFSPPGTPAPVPFFFTPGGTVERFIVFGRQDKKVLPARFTWFAFFSPPPYRPDSPRRFFLIISHRELRFSNGIMRPFPLTFPPRSKPSFGHTLHYFLPPQERPPFSFCSTFFFPSPPPQ